MQAENFRIRLLLFGYDAGMNVVHFCISVRDIILLYKIKRKKSMIVEMKELCCDAGTRYIVLLYKTNEFDGE